MLFLVYESLEAATAGADLVWRLMQPTIAEHTGCGSRVTMQTTMQWAVPAQRADGMWVFMAPAPEYRPADSVSEAFEMDWFPVTES